jgi:ABC-type transport system substrate-binding protein
VPCVFSGLGDKRVDAHPAKKSAELHMNTRRLLIAFPIVLIAALLQASFWVPTYERQEAGNPRRLTTYIEAGIGDAKILNPTISADSASTRISSHVFESLLDIDEEQNLIGDLAERWETREVAYLAVVPGRRLPDGAAAIAQEVARRIRAALAGGALAALAEAVEAVGVLPPETRERTLTLTEADASGQPTQRAVAARAEVPARVELRLNRVVQDLFERLEPVVGAALLAEDGLDAYLNVDAEGESLEALKPQLAELLSVTEHNPVLIFYLRRGVRWHDGHPFDADDVRFVLRAHQGGEGARRPHRARGLQAALLAGHHRLGFDGHHPRAPARRRRAGTRDGAPGHRG